MTVQKPGSRSTNGRLIRRDGRAEIKSRPRLALTRELPSPTVLAARRPGLGARMNPPPFRAKGADDEEGAAVLGGPGTDCHRGLLLASAAAVCVVSARSDVRARVRGAARLCRGPLPAGAAALHSGAAELHARPSGPCLHLLLGTVRPARRSTAPPIACRTGGPFRRGRSRLAPLSTGQHLFPSPVACDLFVAPSARVPRRAPRGTRSPPRCAHALFGQTVSAFRCGIAPLCARPGLWIAAGLTLLGLVAGQPCARAERVVSAGHGMVVSVSQPASEAGRGVLQDGGNAVDAAVATAFALAVTFPEAGNIGGGGFMLISPSDHRETVCVDYRETAPAASTAEMYLGQTSRSGSRWSPRRARCAAWLWPTSGTAGWPGRPACAGRETGVGRVCARSGYGPLAQRGAVRLERLRRTAARLRQAGRHALAGGRPPASAGFGRHARPDRRRRGPCVL